MRVASLSAFRASAAALFLSATIATACGGRVEVNERAGEGGCGLVPCDDRPEVDAGPGDEGGPGGGHDASSRDSSGEQDVLVDGACSTGPGARFATSVVDHHFGTGQSYNQTTAFPSAVLGPPSANDPSSVVSLGNGGWVVLAFAGNAIIDGPGVDFTVFENPLVNFKELATVAVSDDGVTWQDFPCTAPKGGPDYGYCAGVAVVYSSPTNGIDPLDPKVSGGDHYDLADIGVTHARYVRITDRPDIDDVFDLDAVAIVNAECP